jgi:hypothetical protein
MRSYASKQYCFDAPWDLEVDEVDTDVDDEAID